MTLTLWLRIWKLNKNNQSNDNEFNKRNYFSTTQHIKKEIIHRTAKLWVLSY